MIVNTFTMISEQCWKDTSCRLDVWFLHSSLVPCYYRITFPTYSLSSQFHQEIIDTFSSISKNSFFSSMFAPIKLFPLSLWNILAFPLLLVSCLSAWMKLCAVKQLVASTCIALLDKHVNIVPHLSWIFRPALTEN